MLKLTIFMDQTVLSQDSHQTENEQEAIPSKSSSHLKLKNLGL